MSDESQIQKRAGGNIFYSDINEYSGGLLASSDNSVIPISKSTTEQVNIVKEINIPGNCDTIYLKSGVTLIGKIEQINQNDLKYRKCNNLNGPVISVSKSTVKYIRYANGTDEVLSSADPVATSTSFDNVYSQGSSQNGGKTDGLAVAGFLSGFIGLFIAGVILGTIAVVFGSLSLGNIKRDSSRRGRGLAIAAIIIGIVSFVGALIVISSM